MDDVLYHYTSRFQLPLILKAGFLKLTESNLREPSRKEREETNKKWELFQRGEHAPFSTNDGPLYKPVVWLTNMTDPTPLESEFTPKNRFCIRITLRMKPDYVHWMEWSRKQGINLSWAKRFEEGFNAESWFISTQPIFLTVNELLKVENTVTGEIMLDFDTGVRQYECAVEPARGLMPIHHYYDWIGKHGLKKGDVVEFSF